MRHLLSFIFLVLVSFSVLAESAKPKTIGDYRSFYEILEKKSHFFANEKIYDHLVIKNKKTGVDCSIKELPVFTRRIFFLTQAEIIDKKLTALESSWKEDLEKQDNKIAEDIEEKDTSPATINDVKKYLALIKHLRAIHKERWQAYAEALFKEYEDKFTADEVEFYLKQIHGNTEINPTPD